MRAIAYVAVLNWLAGAGVALAQTEPAVENPAPAPAAEEAPAPAATTTPAPVVPAPSSEQQALEQEMAKAHAAVEATKPAATETTTATATKVEEIRAAPVAESPSIEADAGTTSLAAQVKAKEEARAQARPFGVNFVLDHGVGPGTFMRNGYARDAYDYAVESWDFRPYYNFEAFGHKLKASARIMFDIELATPTNQTRRIVPADMSLSLGDARLYEEPVTGITFAGSLRVFLPTSYESLAVKHQWTGTRLSFGATREIGNFSLGYTLGASKYFGARVPSQNATVARQSDGISHNAVGEPSAIVMGYSNPSFDVMNTFSVGYAITSYLSVEYSLLIWNTWGYNLYPERDAKTAENAQVGRQQKLDKLWPSLELAYALSDHMGDALKLPLNLSLAAGITALHPAQSENNKRIRWPFFYSAFGDNQAANNFGSVYVDIVGSY